METVFRTREEPTQEVTEPIATPPKETANIVEGKEDVAISSDEIEPTLGELDKWETSNGKYGAEYLGIKEIAKEFPYNAQFSKVDRFIRDEIKERGLGITRESWQSIINEIEREIGSLHLPTFERLRRLSGYVDVMKRYKEAKKKKESFIFQM